MCRCCFQQKSDADYDDDDDDGESFVELSSLQDHRSVVFSVFFRSLLLRCLLQRKTCAICDVVVVSKS